MEDFQLNSLSFQGEKTLQLYCQQTQPGGRLALDKLPLSLSLPLLLTHANKCSVPNTHAPTHTHTHVHLVIHTHTNPSSDNHMPHIYYIYKHTQTDMNMPTFTAPTPSHN